MEEAEREEEGDGEEEGEESPKELEPEEEEMAMAGEGLDFLCYWLWEEEGVCCGKEPIRVRLNTEKMEDGSAVSHSTRSQLQRRCVFLGGCNVVNEH